MNIIKPKYEIIEQKYDDLLKDMFKHIEICGRTCYKSDDKITEDSYIKFIENLEKLNHGAMLEHGTIYLTIGLGTPMDDPQYMWKMDIINFFKGNKYSKVNSEVINKTVDVEIKGVGMKTQASATFYYITTNWRVIFENKDLLLIKYINNNYHFTKESVKDSVLSFMTQPSEKHEKRYTVRFTYHLAVARDINRHRVQSVGEESTRYCNYSKEKFSDGPGAELNIIEPVWFTDDEKEIIETNQYLNFREMCEMIAKGTNKAAFEAVDYWLFANMACEYAYMILTKEYKWKPQQASLMLPLDTKTTSVHTAFASDWAHLFNLRALGTTGAPRPSAKEVAWPLMEEFLNNEWIINEMIDYQKYIELKNKYSNIEDYIKI